MDAKWYLLWKVLKAYVKVFGIEKLLSNTFFLLMTKSFLPDNEQHWSYIRTSTIFILSQRFDLCSLENNFWFQAFCKNRNNCFLSIFYHFLCTVFPDVWKNKKHFFLSNQSKFPKFCAFKLEIIKTIDIARCGMIF